MNLFIIAWNLPKNQIPEVLSSLSQMTEIYPQLDPNTLWHEIKGDCAFAASLQSQQRQSPSRNYISRTDEALTLYDGALVDCRGGFNAYDAGSLAAHWDGLSERLEGHFVVARLRDNPVCLELMTDFLGMEQVYYFRNGSMWLVSNSVRLLAQIGNATQLDPMGVSQCLSLGWVSGNRTLNRDIEVIPGAQYWKWEQGDLKPRKNTYYDRTQLSRQPKKPLSVESIKQVNQQTIEICRNLARNAGQLDCPITAGRDSRLMASFLVRGGIDAHYYTYGFSDNPDVIVASQIARQFNLSHEALTRTVDDITQSWEDTSWKLVQQNDGTVSLWHIADILGQPTQVDRLFTSLWGVGTGAARGILNTPKNLLGQFGIEDVKEYLANKLVSDRGGLILPEATSMARQYIYEFVDRAIDEGFVIPDIPDLFATYERVRRWGGSNARKVKPIGDFFSPFCTRPFTEAVFSIPAAYRYSESIHYELMKDLVPELHRFPFDKSPWPPQNPWLHILRQTIKPEYIKVRKVVCDILKSMKSDRSSSITTLKRSKKAVEFERSQWIKVNYLKIREICLDCSDSTLWSLVNRSLFEEITRNADTITDYIDSPTNSLRHLGSLYGVSTLFYYACGQS
jgi:asparagine synthase (glutamine-hydrolysing)